MAPYRHVVWVSRGKNAIFNEVTTGEDLRRQGAEIAKSYFDLLTRIWWATAPHGPGAGAELQDEPEVVAERAFLAWEGAPRGRGRKS